MFYYQIYGLNLQVNKPISELVPTHAAGSVDLTVEFLDQPSSASLFGDHFDWKAVYDNGIEDSLLEMWTAASNKGDYTRQRYSGKNDVGTRAWSEFVIDPTGSQVWVMVTAPHQNGVPLLLGPVLTSVLRLHNVTCLHASVVVVGKQAIAILGAKGMGKSTLAAAFSQQGFTILSDDIAALAETQEGFFVQPGYPRLRLTRQAANTLNGTSNTLDHIFPSYERAFNKYYFNLSRNGREFPQYPHPLKAIYLLQARDRQIQEPFITPFPAAAGLMTLVQHTSANQMLTRTQRADEFKVLGRLAARVPLRVVHRPDSLSTLPQVCELIVRDVQSLGNRAAWQNTVKSNKTVVEMLPYVLRDLPTDLAQPESLPALYKMASYLAPIASGGFECRLGAEPQVDLQQCIRANESQLALLHAHWTESVAKHAPTDPIWARLLAFTHRASVAPCRQPSSVLRTTLSEIWLEFDADTLSGALPLPSLFFGVQQEAPDADDRGVASDRLSACQTVLELLLGTAFSHDLRESLHRCFAACTNDLFISHIGVMLSRPTEAVRVNVKRLSPDTVGAYLQQIGWPGWPGKIDEVVALISKVDRYVDRITVCLDVGRTISPRVGLECILLEQPPEESRWAAFLADLVDWGLCLPEKRAALLTWPGQTVMHSERSIVRRLSHIKLDYRPNHPLQAKGYLWFSHEWGPDDH